MIHKMRLYDDFFEKIKNDEKTYEVRLHDNKRRKINIGDTIIFEKYSLSNEKIEVKVKNLRIFKNFTELFKKIPFKLVGFENKSQEEVLQQMYNIYSVQDERQWGVILIEMTTIKKSN